MGKKHFTLIILIFFSMSLIISAQGARDYEISSLRYELIEDDAVIKLSVVVQNSGADATSETNVIVTLLGDEPDILVTDTLIPLSANTSVTLEIPFSVNLFPADSQQELEVRVGIDRFELENTPIAINNIETITIDVPARTTSSNEPVFFERTADGIILLGEEYSLVTIALATLGFVVALMILWIFTIVFRALFSRPPRFGAWQPPYGLMPMYDQNSVEGRRWGWQQLAQNGLLLAPANNGNIHPVKLLMSSEGRNLENWKVTGMRLSQYDIYGRIARTQVIADKGLVKRMNKILQKRDSIDEAKLQKMLRPITQKLVKKFSKKVRNKTSFLPISFDMRWEGSHGDVQITFELYQFSDNAWYRIDQWNPMMQIVSQTMQENYTFTIHGKENAEKMKAFRERLRDDLIWLLLESFRVEAVPEPQPDELPVSRQQFNIPDTLSGMTPIPAQDQPLPNQS